MYFANHAVYRNSKSFSKTLMTAFHVTEFCKDDFYSFSLKASKQNKDVSQTQDRKPFERSNSTSLKKLLLHYRSPERFHQIWQTNMITHVPWLYHVFCYFDNFEWRRQKENRRNTENFHVFSGEAASGREKQVFIFQSKIKYRSTLSCVLANALISGISNYECNVINTFQHLQAT